MAIDEVFAEIDRHFDEAVDDLVAFCQFASSRDNEQATLACAEWLRARFERAGLEARLLSVPGSNPLVYASVTGETPRRLLFVNHYDVEVGGRLEEWTSPPFAPTMRDGRLVGRGTADNKGCVMARLWAVESLLRVRGRLPHGVAFAVEAKVDIFAPHFDQIVSSHRDLFRCDACLWENALNHEDGRPTLRLGDKGMLALEVRSGADARLPLSSQFAAFVPGAAWGLVWALAALRPSPDRVPDWLRKGIVPLSPHEEALLEALPLEPPDRAPLISDAHEQTRRLRSEPTCNLSTVAAGSLPRRDAPLSAIPGAAAAYLDLRLLPQQDPDVIAEQVRAIVRQASPGSEVTVLGRLRPHRTPIDHPFVAEVRRAAHHVWGAEPRLEPLSAASGSRQAIAEIADVPIVGTGIARADSRVLRPDENVRLEDYRNGIKLIAALLASPDHMR